MQVGEKPKETVQLKKKWQREPGPQGKKKVVKRSQKS